MNAVMPLARRPSDRLLALGPRDLGDDELCAVLLSPLSTASEATAVARQVLRRYPTLTELYRSGPRDLATLPDLGLARACRLSAGLELGRRMAHEAPAPTRSAAPDALFTRFRELVHEDVETVIAVALSSRDQVLAHFEVGRGHGAGCQLTPREVFIPVLRAGATRVAVVHNHPSGDAEPSPEDARFTQRLERAGETLGVRLVDHVIIARGGYVSLRTRGLVVG
ncbi:MAG: UPF0758 protein [Myxococcales bacterium]